MWYITLPHYFSTSHMYHTSNTILWYCRPISNSNDSHDRRRSNIIQFDSYKIQSYLQSYLLPIMQKFVQNFTDTSAFYKTSSLTWTDRLSYHMNQHVPPLSFTRLQGCDHVTGDAGPRYWPITTVDTVNSVSGFNHKSDRQLRGKAITPPHVAFVQVTCSRNHLLPARMHRPRGNIWNYVYR